MQNMCNIAYLDTSLYANLVQYYLHTHLYVQNMCNRDVQFNLHFKFWCNNISTLVLAVKHCSILALSL